MFSDGTQAQACRYQLPEVTHDVWVPSGYQVFLLDRGKGGRHGGRRSDVERSRALGPDLAAMGAARAELIGD
jgi:hypothetical protein